LIVYRQDGHIVKDAYTVAPQVGCTRWYGVKLIRRDDHGATRLCSDAAPGPMGAVCSHFGTGPTGYYCWSVKHWDALNEGAPLWTDLCEEL
jgi:hypothetical protein